jgi:hypothetical protein
VLTLARESSATDRMEAKVEICIMQLYNTDTRISQDKMCSNHAIIVVISFTFKNRNHVHRLSTYEPDLVTFEKDLIVLGGGPS